MMTKEEITEFVSAQREAHESPATMVALDIIIQLQAERDQLRKIEKLYNEEQQQKTHLVPK